VIISVLSGIALLIAVIGANGLLAYTIAERFPELAIRLALGASSVQVSWLMLRQAMLRALTGVVSGLVGAWFLARFLQSLLFGVEPHDPVIYAAVASVLTIASLVAVLVPARRILQINPAAALRAD
jgi:putative ABC transport system permease protein